MVSIPNQPVLPGNTHFWMLDETGMAKGLVYWERASNSVRLQAWGGSNGLIHDLAADALFSGANRIHHDGNASRGAPDWVLEDQKASGTSGGTATSGSWETRKLNTEVCDPLGLVTLASNEFASHGEWMG